MTRHNSPEGMRHFGRTLGLGLTLGLALLVNLGDRAFSASAANGGIDPLQILDTAVTNNILFIVDTSGSMAGTPEDQNRIMGGDDPASRFYQVKRAVRDVITQNAGKANFGLASFHPDFSEHLIDGGQGLVYVTQDPSATAYINYFDAFDTTLANVNDDNCGAGGASVVNCVTTSGGDAMKIFRGFRTAGDSAVTSAYPSPCTVQPLGNHVTLAGVPVAPAITHINGVAGSNHCRYYMKSSQMRSGRRYHVKTGLVTGSGSATARQRGAIVASEDITCPLPPAGLLGDDVLGAANGTVARGCVQFKNVTSATASTQVITTYWITGTNFDFVDVNAPIGSQCQQSGINVDVADCGVDNSEQINSYMRMELQYNGPGGTPRDILPLTDLNGRKPNSGETPAFSLDITPPITPPFNNPGIRQGNGTPLAASMAFALTYFRNTVLAAGGTNKRPVVAQGRQKQFVILLSDGDEACSGDAPTAAYNLWSNTLPTLPACTGTCLTAKGITAAQWSVANRIELLTITFAGGTPANVDAISRAGTGRNPANSTCQPLYPGFGATPLSPCRTAFIANNLTDLVNALNAAINTSTATGEFSDQQSVTETVFEFGNVGVPSAEPLDPEDRYSNSVPILLQSTFELPGWMGHLNAFRRNGSASLQVWDAGQTLRDRVANVPKGMGAGLYKFDELYGSPIPTPTNILTSNAKIKRRIFTTTQNGVNPNYNPNNLVNLNSGLAWTRVPLWPPTVGGTDNTFIAPNATGTGAAPVRGRLDTAMGFDSWTTVAQVQAAVYGACQGSVVGDIHAECTSATAGVPLARAKREAREIILAYMAGAQLNAANGLPIRIPNSGGPVADRGQLQYVVRPWVLSESTLAAPGVVTPPLLAGPKAGVGAVGVDEYKVYRDGLKVSEIPVNVTPGQVSRGLGLRNPDRLLSTMPQTAKDAAAGNPELKPVMSVVYHATNMGLHAFRAGPCPLPSGGGGLFGTGFDCSTSVERSTDADPLLKREVGGEELWSFVPFDVLGKLPALTKLQGRGDKQYLLAAPVRFSDIFVPGGASVGGVSVGNGVWRTIMYFGRGQGGKYYTAIDVTAPGPFTRHSLNAELPIVVWSRGNPDTSLGAAGGSNNGSGTDYTAYLGMGETWSVPSVGFVSAASYSGAAFVLFTGSGYSDITTPVTGHSLGEGKTFYVLDALNGNVIKNFDIANGTPSPVPAPATNPYTNFLVASPVVYAEDADGNSPSGYRFIGNPIGAKAKSVYFGDLHGRIWRYDANSPNTAPAAFFTASAIGNQPFATAVSVLQNRPDATLPGEVFVFAESGLDRRVPVPTEGNRPPAPGAPPFKAFAFKDPMTGGAGVLQFSRNFEVNYRGSVQPASAFAQASPAPATPVPPTPVVFYAGSKFTSSLCIGTFDSILIALKAEVAVPGSAPLEAFDLKATGDDAFIEFTGKKINAIRVSGEGSLVIDQGLNAENPPPPPGMAVPSETISTSSSLVTLGLQPNTQAFRDLSATTVPFRVGSSVCTTQ